jgi:flagellar biosynthesis protein FlhF
MVLVLPAGLDPAEAIEMAHAYAAAGANLLVATRLDLARRLGGVLAAAGAGLALTEAGVGPGAADGMLPITPAWLAARLVSGIKR